VTIDDVCRAFCGIACGYSPVIPCSVFHTDSPVVKYRDLIVTDDHGHWAYAGAGVNALHGKDRHFMVTKNGQDDQGTQVIPIDGFTDEALKNFDSWDQVVQETGNVTSAADVLGNGYSILEDKSKLLNEPFMIVKYGVHPSELNGKVFTTIHVLTKGGDKYVVNDGSTGIHQQLMDLKTEMGTICPLMVPRGLRVSEYDYEDPKNGSKTKAKTYYINTAK
jgi:hypothetical protein